MPASKAHDEWTVISFDVNESTNVLVKALSNAKLKWDICAHSPFPLIDIGKAEIKEAYYDLKKRGIKISWITEITKDNLQYCKELMKFGEVKHLDGIKCSFATSQIECVSVTMLKDELSMPQLIYSNVKGIVEQYQYLFETLSDKAIPAIKKIKEIEEGKEPEIIEIISDHIQTLYRYIEILRSSENEVMLIIPSLNTLYRIKNVGIIDLLIDISQKSNVKVRMIIPFETSTNREEINKIIVENRNLYIRYAEIGIPHTNFTILVADGEHSLVIELNDDTKENFFNAIGFAIYSNTKPNVTSYSTIFENLWILTEIHTHLKESNKELEKSYDDIKIREDLISKVTHELRTPLVPIKGYIEMLLMPKIMGVDLNDKQRKAILSIQRNVEREISLVDDILDVYTIDSGKLNLNKQNVDVTELVNQVINDLQSLLIEKHIEIKSNYGLPNITSEKSIPIIVTCDPNKMEQVLSNLIKNSIDFVPEKEGKILIKVEQNNEFNEIIFTVEDNGIGIPKDKVDDVFKQFYQIRTEIERKHGGTGLGLAICKGIIKAHDGRIWIEKDEHIGTKIKFSLPMNKDSLFKE
jgi:signal transduction histidine kinase